MAETHAEYNCKSPTFLAAAVFPKYAIVKFDGAGKLVVATAADRAGMIANREAFVIGDPISVTLLHQAGLVKLRANAAIAAEATCYAAADGEVAPAGTVEVGQVAPLEGRANGGAATADQDIVVVLPTNL